MQVNNIALSITNCRKPRGFLSFEANNDSAGEKRRVRYKHYEELSDDVVKARSIIKAHQDAQRSGKMHLYKALPTIATGIITTTIALTRPGKLSAKAASGLGFLATVAGVSAIGDVIFSKDNTQRKKAFATLGALGTIGTGALMMSSTAKSGKINQIAKFLTKETKQLAKEIDKTKLSKLSNKYIEPFIEKHTKCAMFAPIVSAVSSSVVGALASVGLIKGISKDISENACKNYEKAKAIQKIAREHFDSVDAIEV